MAPLERRRRRPRGWARVRRSPWFRWGLVVAAVGVIGLGTWFALTLKAVYSDLDVARGEALVLRASLQRGDLAGARTAAATFSSASASAHGHTDGVAWSAMGLLPVVGDDARGVADASSALDEIGSQGLPPLLTSGDQLTAGAYAPRDHRFPLALISSLAGPASRSAAAFDQASTRLDDVDSSGFTSGLRSSFDDLRDQVDAADTALDAARRAAQVMPDLLGADGPRNYLFVFQNNAELRATGGLPGALSLVHAENGHVEITRQTAAGGFRPLAVPILPLTTDEQRVYGPQLGTFFLDANFAPDFPRASELWAARWQAEFGQRLDGVFIVDPVVLSYLLEATGPLQVDGVTLTAANVVQVVENSVYVNLGNDPAAQDAFFQAVAKAAFDTFANGTGDQVGLVRALVQGVQEGRAAFHSFDPADQQVIAGTAVAHELPTVATADPQVGVYLDDGTEAKMSYYLDYDVRTTAASCSADGVQTISGELVATNRTPPDVTALPQSVTGYLSTLGDIRPGQQVVTADVMAPVGGTITRLQFDDSGRSPILQSFKGRAVMSVGLTLDPGETQRVDWTMTTGPGQTGPVQTSVTPGAQPGTESSVAPSSCR